MTRLTRLAMVTWIERTGALLRRTEVGDDEREDGKHQRHHQYPAVTDPIPEKLPGDGTNWANSMFVT